MRKVGEFFVLMLVAIPLAIWKAYCISILWGWFITPVFGMPSPSMVAILGLLIFIPLAYPVFPNESDDFAERLGKLIGQSGIVPLIGLGVGWLYHLFM